MNTEPITVEAGNVDSLWPSVSYVVHPENALMTTEMEDPDAFLNFIATREPHMREEHLKKPKTKMREYDWDRQYQSLLRGEDLAAYKQLLEEPWTRVAVARSIDDKWDSFWRANTDGTGAHARSGTIIFARSGNSEILAEVDVYFSPDYVTMFTDSLRVTLESAYDPEFDKKVANWLLMTQFWSIPFYPFPHVGGEMDITSRDAALIAFALGGKGTLIISDSEPVIADTYTIVRLINEKMNIPYVRLLLHARGLI
jgi:hypothetical protein